MTISNSIFASPDTCYRQKVSSDTSIKVPLFRKFSIKTNKTGAFSHAGNDKWKDKNIH